MIGYPWPRSLRAAHRLSAPSPHPATKPRLVDQDQTADGGFTRDPALFNLAIDNKLRGCDVVAIRVDDVAPSGYAVERATVRQRKAGRRVAVRADRPSAAGARRLLEADRPKTCRLLLIGYCSGALTGRQRARLAMGCQHLGSIEQVQHPVTSPHESGADLTPDRKSVSGAALARTHEDQEHRSLSRHRGRDAIEIAEKIDI